MQILTSQGYKDITDCEVGDLVKAYEVGTGNVIWNSIAKIEETLPTEFIEYQSLFDDEFNYVGETETNREHTFWYKINDEIVLFGKQSIWRQTGETYNICHAFDLQVGDIIYDDNDQDLEITSIDSWQDDAKTWYKLVISNDHSFIQDGITLHNASRYWVGGTGTWNNSNTTSWSSSSGGAGGASIPVNADDVFIDSNSGGGTITVGAGNANCTNLNCTGFTGTLTTSSSQAYNIYGDLTLDSGMTGFSVGGGSAVCNFRKASGTATITSNGLTWGGGTATTSNPFTLNGNGTFQLADDINIAGMGSVTRIAGTLDPNGKTFTLSGTSQIINYSFSFYNLTRTGTATKNDYLQLNTDITVTNNFTCNGNSDVNRVFIYSNTIGTARTITCNGTVSVTNTDFQDITGAGSGSWNLASISGGSGDCGGNSGITFTTSQTNYWKRDAASTWSDASYWYLATNGGGGAGRVPLPQDDAVIDSNSYAATNRTMTLDMPRMGKNISIDSVRVTLTGTIYTRVFGSVTITNAVSAAVWYVSFYGRGNHTISSTVTINRNSNGFGFNIYAFGGTYTLQSNIVTGGFYLYNGTFDTNGYNLNADVFSITGTSTRQLNLGSSLLTITGGWATATWNATTTTNLTFNAGTSTIKSIVNSNITFNGGGLTYNNIWFAPASGSRTYTIVGSNTFNNVKIEDSQIVKFTAGITTTVSSFTATGTSGGGITITSVTAATHTLSCASGTISVEYCTISYSIATGVATWNAPTADGNTDGGNNTGWNFESGETYTKNLSDTFTLTTVFLKTPIKVFNNLSTLSETILKAPQKTFSEAVGLTEVISKIKTAVKILVDSIGLTEILSKGLAYIRTLSDSLGLTEVLIKVKGYFKTLTDNLYFNRINYDANIKYDDPIPYDGLDDWIERNIGKNLTDNFTLSEVFSRVLVLTRVLIDNIGLNDILTKIKESIKILTESITATANVYKEAIKNIIDNFTLTDVFSRSVILTRILIDNIGLTEIKRILLNGVQQIWTKITHTTSSSWDKITHITSSTWGKITHTASSIWTKRDKPWD